MKEPDKEICSTLDEVGQTFEENELAYLAATSKIEFPFRDRLAFLLHKRFNQRDTWSRGNWEPCLLALTWRSRIIKDNQYA